MLYLPTALTPNYSSTASGVDREWTVYKCSTVLFAFEPKTSSAADRDDYHSPAYITVKAPLSGHPPQEKKRQIKLASYGNDFCAVEYKLIFGKAAILCAYETHFL